MSYKLKFPFNEFVNSNILMEQAVKAYEPNQTLINQALQENDNENLQIGSLKSHEPQIIGKNQEATPKNATSLQIGDPNGIRTRVAALRGPRPRPLDDGTVKTKNVIGYI